MITDTKDWEKEWDWKEHFLDLMERPKNCFSSKNQFMIGWVNELIHSLLEAQKKKILEKTTEMLMSEYNLALKEKRDDESNGYAHAIAILRSALKEMV